MNELRNLLLPYAVDSILTVDGVRYEILHRKDIREIKGSKIVENNFIYTMRSYDDKNRNPFLVDAYKLNDLKESNRLTSDRKR